MPKQSRRFTWRVTKRGSASRARELWLHRPREESVHVGGIEPDWDGSWFWYSTERPWNDRPQERYTSQETYATPEEAMARLRSRPHIQEWPKKHCVWCTKIGCTHCDGETRKLRE